MEVITVQLTMEELKNLQMAVGIAEPEVFPSKFSEVLDRLYNKLELVILHHSDDAGGQD